MTCIYEKLYCYQSSCLSTLELMHQWMLCSYAWPRLAMEISSRKGSRIMHAFDKWTSNVLTKYFSVWQRRKLIKEEQGKKFYKGRLELSWKFVPLAYWTLSVDISNGFQLFFKVLISFSWLNYERNVCRKENYSACDCLSIYTSCVT